MKRFRPKLWEYPCIYVIKPRKTTKKISQDSLLSGGQDLKTGPRLEYEGGVPTAATRTASSVQNEERHFSCRLSSCFIRKYLTYLDKMW